MSPKKCSTAIVAILMLGAAPLMAQTTTPAENAAAAADAASDAAQAVQDAAAAVTEAAEDAAATANEAAAAASEATTAETPAADAPAETPADAPAEAAAAEPAEPQIGAYYARATHGDWTVRCIRTPNNADPCELYQLMQDGNGNSVAEISLIPLQNGQAAAGATLVSPLETDLTAGVGLQIDSGAQNTYPFNLCAPVGCVSRIGFTDAELAALRRGNAATVSVLPYGAPREDIVNLRMSLTGFTAGFTELEAAHAEMRAAAEAAAETEAAPAQ
ncbi:MAG: invasion associated locus B family protein [Paracoccus sp. (in: a-proteobacteria)]|nr:invasion associated locus B family protein [Paracoccus sp. (in: a-proteobacteria)]